MLAQEEQREYRTFKQAEQHTRYEMQGIVHWYPSVSSPETLVQTLSSTKQSSRAADRRCSGALGSALRLLVGLGLGSDVAVDLPVLLHGVHLGSTGRNAGGVVDDVLQVGRRKGRGDGGGQVSLTF